MEPYFYYNEYHFDKDKNYLIYFRGNFGPPTRGHYSLVSKFNNFPNVKILISQIGSERHGVPYHLNRKIWKIYIKELLTTENIYLKKLNSSLDVLEYIEDIDIVVFLRGNETNNKKEKEKQLKERYFKLFYQLKRKGIKLEYLIIDRPYVNILSTSKFIEHIKQGSSYEKLRFFVPKKLSDKSFIYIINKLKMILK